MYTGNSDRQFEIESDRLGYRPIPLAFMVQPDVTLIQWLEDLSPDKPWADRKKAAQELGATQSPQALNALLEALPVDPFWMVRCAIIQALERIGDPRAIPELRQMAKRDGFEAVRTYASKAIERLSSLA
jgi:HEAT repeat protein